TLAHLVVSGQLPRKQKSSYIYPESQPELVQWS
ncbi:MAG: hypothetical protein RLZZ115_378, partial [Cyanobacteriota bacterium]